MQPLDKPGILKSTEPDNARSAHVGCTRRRFKYRVNAALLNKLSKIALKLPILAIYNIRQGPAENSSPIGPAPGRLSVAFGMHELNTVGELHPGNLPRELCLSSS